MELTHFFYKEPTWELTQAIPFKAVNLLVGKNIEEINFKF